ncbi:MAG: glutamate racemase [Chitinophagales bacterium]|nr:glutamate racemase [Chitinophagales bacterium]MDW8418660.1 glutamate racemase [Chitinophagales bacterium]
MEQRHRQPIGIFDSGIGGLTVAKAIADSLPNEKIIYYGDTAHIPYGDKSQELISKYASRITEFLLHDKQCKAVVIACNTASAAAYNTLRDRYKGIAPIINVIDPMIEAVISDDAVKHVGVIATKTTIASGVYQEKFTRRKPSLRFSALATPLLAPMIEEGFYNNNISHAVLEKYLRDEALQGIDALVLACTHYPLIKKEIDAFYGGGVKIFDSAEVVAAKLKNILTKEQLHTDLPGGTHEFLVSDYTRSFEKSTQMFYGKELHLSLHNIWA